MKLLFIRLVYLLSIILFVSFSSVLLWDNFSKSALTLSGPRTIRDAAATSKQLKVKQNPANKKKNAVIDKLLASYSTSWEKQKDTFKKYRSLLGSTCNAISNAVVTQSNSPVGTNFTYDGLKKKIKVVTPDLFSIFPKESPFQKAPYGTCAVVGNGGILANSSCGKQIDSATFVIRCNLPPLTDVHKLDTGQKTNLVTANPSILFQKYQALNERRRSFVEDVQVYRDALLLLPAFSFQRNTAVSLRALYSLEDLKKSCPRPIFYNPTYLNNLATFWRNQGIRAKRLSTGMMMVSLALELCNNVHLYGFWPFETHPYTHQELPNHYYDNRPANKEVHAMPAEFESLLNLHNKGVIHLQLGECAN
ncbi:alpha-2,8-sialyltransferase 8F-like [Neoarius graeffei]|uniref:alpha-2,8-sialyltransferase 8F-like n=1 Tax=Neoarius graeffei TaxID=443677 RepID=UPI00298D5E33|nr:alpha-2,8-sialyltransferase 8F-like [Neoarius graeffei]